jgi:hypothetical protein
MTRATAGVHRSLSCRSLLLTGLAIWLFVKEKAPARRGRRGGETEKQIHRFVQNRNLLLVYLMVFCSLFGFFVILTVAALLPAKRARHCGQRNRLYHLAGRLDLNPWRAALLLALRPSG